MLYAYAARFDIIENVKNFAKYFENQASFALTVLFICCTFAGAEQPMAHAELPSTACPARYRNKAIIFVDKADTFRHSGLVVFPVVLPYLKRSSGKLNFAVA